MTTDDADESVAKQQQQQPESSVLCSGSAVLDPVDYESVPEDEWIASDMTMYDSPLAELERQHCYAMDTSNLIPVSSVSTSEPASTQPETSIPPDSSDNSSA